METEAGLVVGPAVAALVGKTIHRTVTAGSSDVSALVPPNTQMVQIGYTDSTPARARAGADAYAEAFLANREAVAKEVNDRQLDLLNEQATAVSRSLERVSKDAASDSPSPESAALVQLNGNRLSNLQDLIGQLQATDIDPGSVVTPATTPSRRTGLDPRLIVGAAALLGLLLATVVAVWRDRADDRLRVSEEDSIGEVPYFATLQAGRPSRAGHNAERHRLANAYRQVRALLLTSAGQPAVVVLAAADQHSDPAVPTITANLAVTLTDASYRVCLVDLSEAAHAEKVLAPGAEPPAPGSGPGLEDPVGLIESLPTLRGIALLAAGRLPVDDPGLLVSARFADLVTALRAAFDVVLVAAAPALTARGTESSLAADRMVLLVTDRVSTHEGVAEVIARQARMRVPVVGMVALRAAGRASGPADFDALPPLHTNRLVENPALGKETIAATAPKAPDSGDEHQAARQIDLTDAGPDTTQPMPPVLKATRFVPPGPVTPDRTTGKRS
jgi:Mrp family chromosome partitioning ATPase